MVAFDLLSVIVVLFTLTLQETSAFFIFAVMETEPVFFAVTFPYVFTDAILELLLFQVGRFPFEVIAISWNSSPTLTTAEYLDRIMNEIEPTADTLFKGKENRIRVVHNKKDNTIFFDCNIEILHS
jgi:hypothetical protein